MENVAPVSSTARKTLSPIFTRIQKTKSSSSEPPPYSSSGNLTSTSAAMRDLAIQASRLFSEFFPSGEALSPCGRFLGSPAARGGVAAGADERLCRLGGPPLRPPLPPPLPPLSPFWGVSGGRLGPLAFSLLPLEFITLAFLSVTFVFVLTTFATIATGDGTPEMILMGHSFPIFGMLLSFHLQHTATAVIAVRGMATSPLVIDRFAVEQWGCTCIKFNLIHGT